MVRAWREQCGAAQGGHAVRAGAETICLVYILYQRQLKAVAFSCLPSLCHKLLANIKGVTGRSLSRLLRKPLKYQQGTNMLLDRCQQVTNRITTNWEEHANREFQSSCVHASGFRQILEQLCAHRALNGSNCSNRYSSYWLSNFPTTNGWTTNVNRGTPPAQARLTGLCGVYQDQREPRSRVQLTST